jgi:hypothetical protein
MTDTDNGFKPGDVVCLKSDPNVRMNVRIYNAYETHVVYLDRLGHLCNGVVDSKALQRCCSEAPGTK